MTCYDVIHDDAEQYNITTVNNKLIINKLMAQEKYDVI